MSALIAPGAAPHRRQTILSAPLNANGSSNLLSSGAGLQVIIAAPLVVSAAAGFGSAGAIDIVRLLSTAGAAAVADTFTWRYIYADVAAGLSFGETGLPPLYVFGLPAAPAADQHAFVVPEMQMYRYTGTAWVRVYRVFLGRALANAGAVITVESFAVCDLYDSGWFSIAAATEYIKTHSVLNSVIWPCLLIRGLLRTSASTKLRPVMQIDNSGTNYYGDALSLGVGDGINGGTEEMVCLRTASTGAHPLVGAGVAYPDAGSFATAQARLIVDRGF